MKKILFLLPLLFLSSVAIGQTKKVALLETLVGTGSMGVEGVELVSVRGEIRKALVNQPGYQAFSRTDIDQMMKEQKFQQSGMVSDDQRKRIGVMSGADYICVSTVSKGTAQYYLEAYLIDVETGEISNPASQWGTLSGTQIANLGPLCQDLAQELVGYVGSYSGGSAYSPPAGNSTASRGQDFTETAFGINMRMVYVEGGTFTMGCTGEQGSDCDDDESPNRVTTVGSYYIGMLEVTQSQWEKVMGTSVYQQRNKANPEGKMWGVGADYPMYYVSWEEAKEFCARLSRQTGRNYRLPTEAEWEYAARGGNRNEGTKYSGGWTIDDVAWYSGNSNSSTHPCGTKRGNALGIYDMSGNVWEWCEDWYGSSYLQYDNTNPRGASTGSYRVLRGGCWSDSAEGCRVSDRNSYTPDYRGRNNGFRVVLH